MGLKSFARSAVVATAVAAAGVSIVAQPASAGTTLNYAGASGQFDNNPGNGAASWVWIWAGWDNSSARTEYQYYDGSTGAVWANTGQSNTANLGKDVWRIRVCVSRWDNTITWCSSWT
ncbi:hypothetical protein JOL79_14150 [Microbispora sp. RL4-1S]|uniref:Lactococcin 972 family bacteriocin n=1 Tax=Microbispora oryzae TaxID=2806554 RepID=A0A940WG10_9ACTN|nr:hypothetical protein [Microbispora oryzae]MBP2704959.1 hypothetical protein [Microbispora oryzae]